MHLILNNVRFLIDVPEKTLNYHLLFSQEQQRAWSKIKDIQLLKGKLVSLIDVTLHCISEPFDIMSWIFILLMCIHVVSVTVFLFEWLSPRGYDMQKLPPRGNTFWGGKFFYTTNMVYRFFFSTFEILSWCSVSLYVLKVIFCLGCLTILSFWTVKRALCCWLKGSGFLSPVPVHK